MTLGEGKVELQPAPQPGFGGFGAFTGTVEVRLNGDGSITLNGLVGGDGRLEVGRICAVCSPDEFPDAGFALDGGGLLGPMGVHACDGPVPADPCSLR